MKSKTVWKPIRPIVIIEDDMDFSQSLTQMLGKLGYETTISTAGRGLDLLPELPRPSRVVVVAK